MATQLRGSPFVSHPPNEIINFLIKKWTWIINVSAMLSVVDRFSVNDTYSVEIGTVKEYLEEQDLLEEGAGGDVVGHLCDTLIDSLLEIDYAPAKFGVAIAKMSRSLKNVRFDKAFIATSKILKREGGKALVFIDSIEQYNLNDNINECVVISLDEAVRQCYLNSKKTKFGTPRKSRGR